MKNNTGEVHMDNHGAVLVFRGVRHATWRNIPNEVIYDDTEDFLRFDLATNEQLHRDITDLRASGLELVIDLENHGHERPIPVQSYLENLERYLKERPKRDKD